MSNSVLRKKLTDARERLRRLPAAQAPDERAVWEVIRVFGEVLETLIDEIETKEGPRNAR